MNYLDLFSGIGGFALGAQMAGIHWDTHHFSEIEPYAVQVYRKQFPEAIERGSVKAIKGQKLIAQYGDQWCITGGFPCQDLSLAGSQRGLSGSRSGLWHEMLRENKRGHSTLLFSDSLVNSRNGENSASIDGWKHLPCPKPRQWSR